MRSFCSAVHGVSIKVAVEGDVPPARIFSSLYVLPWCVESPGCWHIDVHSSETVSTACPDSARVLYIWPDTKVRYWNDAGVFVASTSGAVARLDSATKSVCLDFSPRQVGAAERLGRFVVLEILRREGFFAVHAGAVEAGGGAMLVCGASGTGKSTLATAWACTGDAKFMAEDRCVIFRRDGILWAGGIADELGLRPDTLSLLEKSGIRLPSEAKQVDDKTCYDCNDFFLSLCRHSCPVKALFFLDDLPAGTADILPCSAEEAFKRIHKGSFYDGAPDLMQVHFEMIADVCASTPAYLVRRGLDCRKTVAELDSLVAGKKTSARPVYPPAEQSSFRGSPDRAKQASDRLCKVLSGSETETLSSLQDDEWRDIVRAADRNGMIPILGATLGGNGFLDRFSNPLPNVLRVALREAGETREIHLNVIRMLAGLLRGLSVRWALFDGPSIAERFYTLPESRYYHRLNIVAAAGTGDRVVETLGGAGFSMVPRTSSDRSRVPDEKAVLMRNAGLQYEICIHAPGREGKLGRTVMFDIGGLLEAAETMPVDGIEVPVPSVSDQFLLTCTVPAASPDSRDLPHLYDIAQMARLIPEDAYPVIIAKANRLHCLVAVGSAVKQAAAVFPSREQDRLKQALCLG
jgi:ferredoxin